MSHVKKRVLNVDLRLSAMELADPLWPPNTVLTGRWPVEPYVRPEVTPLLRDTHCIVWLKGMTLLDQENLPRPLRPGVYYTESADGGDFAFVKRSLERGASVYNTRVTWHTDTLSDASPQPSFPIVANAKLMELVEAMEKRRALARTMIETTVTIFEEHLHGAATDREHQDYFAIVCFLQDLCKHPDLLRLEIDLLP